MNPPFTGLKTLGKYKHAKKELHACMHCPALTTKKYCKPCSYTVSLENRVKYNRKARYEQKYG